MTRYRRNIRCLTTDQLHDLREAWAALYALPEERKESYLKIAGYHGSPSPTWCIHGSPGFLTWHRAYAAVFEDALRCINPDVALPYWNWSSGSTTGVPDACASPTYVDRNGDEAPNPLYRGPIAPAAGGGQTSRRPDIDTTSFGDLASNAQAAMGQTDFSSFQSQLNGVHGSVHVRVGGNMAGVPTAAFDPIFHLHHCNVDRLWANWQNANTAALPAGEALLTLEPFERQFGAGYLTGADVVSTDALGYRYANLCLIRIPWRVWKWIDLSPLIVGWRADEITAARFRLVSERMPMVPMELRLFASDERGRRFDASTPCHGNSDFLGSLGLFGMARPGEEMPMGMGRRGEKFDVQVDVTEGLRRALGGPGEVGVTIVPVKPDGSGIEAEALEKILAPELVELSLE